MQPSQRHAPKKILPESAEIGSITKATGHDGDHLSFSLNEGSHRIEARTVDFLGRPGPAIAYEFTIEPPWFRTPLAFLGYVLAFAASLLAAAQWRTGRIRRHNAQSEQLVNRHTEELARADATLELQAEPSLLDATLVGDPDRIRHILVNYLANALKFGGNAPVQVAVRNENGTLMFSVIDHGPGIPPEEQNRLFVRFSRGSLAYRDGIPGTGLGLAACEAYAEAMGGRVSVQSEPGQGATFSLHLPMEPATAGAPAPVPTSPNLMVGKYALVVDDQDFNRFVLTELLGRMGATARQASSIDEARSIFCERAPDIVFVDFDLTGATGADFALWIRREAPAARDVPVVATTAFEVDEVRRRCEEAGMDGFVHKPVTAPRLAEAVARIEVVRGGGRPSVQGPEAPEAAVTYRFLDILAGGDSAPRTEIERSTRREVLLEALAAHRALQRHHHAETAHHAHRLVSAALILDQRPPVAAGRELQRLAKDGDLPRARTAAAFLRRLLREARRKPPR